MNCEDRELSSYKVDMLCEYKMELTVERAGYYDSMQDVGEIVRFGKINPKHLPIFLETPCTGYVFSQRKYVENTCFLVIIGNTA